MALKIDEDGLPLGDVGEWAKQKHDYLRRYLDISRSARKKYIGPGKAGATFIDLFCGPGKAQVRETGELIDGSAVAAWKISVEGGAPFSAVYVADLDDDLRAAAVKRLRGMGAPVHEIKGAAVEAAATVASRIDPYGLHFAFIDPFSLGALDFRIIKSLSPLRRIDMLIHISAMDLQRNLGVNVAAEISAWDDFAPGWREYVDDARPQSEVRRQLVEYWRKQVTGLGVWPSTDIRAVQFSWHGRNAHGMRVYVAGFGVKTSLPLGAEM